MFFAIMEGLLDARQLAVTDQVLAQAVFKDGKETVGQASRAVKTNLEMDADATPNGEMLQAMVVQALRERAEFQAGAFPLKFSRPILSKYQDGMEYGLHEDNPLLAGPMGMMRTDVSCTIFLAEPESYDGGELELEIAGERRKIKLKRGDAVAYETGTPHRVCPVTRGARLAAVIFAQSLIADRERRRIISNLHQAHEALIAKDPNAPETEQINHAYYNLMRLWADV